MSPYPSYLTTTQCALYTGVTRETIRQEILNGVLPALKRRQRHRTEYRIEVNAFRAYLLERGSHEAVIALNRRFP